MTNHLPNAQLILVCAVLLGALAVAPAASAHCDGLDGPVVTAAREALEKGDADLVLVWVQKADEPEIRSAFQKSLAVRRLSPQAKDLADMYFFETLVRVHRAGEGAPYTGLKPAGRDLGPAIPAADRALETGNAEDLTRLLVNAVRSSLRLRLDEALEARRSARASVEAGRKYVAAYVPFIHYVERLYEAATQPVEGHMSESQASPMHGGQEH